MLAGVVAGYLFTKLAFGRDADAVAMILGALVAGFVTVLMIGFVSKSSRVKDDTAIGIMYTGIFAVGGLLTSVFSGEIHIHLYDFIVGMLMAINDGKLWMLAIVAAVVLTVVILFYRQLKITTFDPVMAASIGVPVLVMDYVLTTCTSLVVVSAVTVVGIVLVVGLLVTPAATAYLLCNRLSRMLPLSAAFGVSSVAIGLYAATWAGDVAPGAAIVLVSTAQFLLVLVVAPHYGLIADWLRRVRSVPQQIVEDVLDSIRRRGGTAVPLAAVLEDVSAHSEQVRRAVALLDRQELLDQTNGELELTRRGQREARRILRAHRLWESYLAHVGAPREEIHDQAHVLEHIYDEQAVDYLDDKLGHPIRDPHGSLIPEDFVHLVPGAVVNAALLRDGHRAVVTEVGEAGLDAPRVGEAIIAGPREDDGATWTFKLPEGRTVRLTHEQADAVKVRLEPAESSEPREQGLESS